jgi:hypothetical protein
MRAKSLFTRRTTSVVASLGAAALAATLLTAATPTPDRGGPGCAPAWSTLPVTNDPAGVADVDAVAPGNAWFAQNHQPNGPASKLVHWENGALSVPEQQVPAPPRLQGDLILHQVSIDDSGTGWAVTGQWPSDVNIPVVLGRFDGTRWSLTPGPVSPKPADGYFHIVKVVSMAPDDAWAVGVVVNGGRGVLGVVTARWNGDEWTIVDNPFAEVPNAELLSVEAESATDINAAGYRVGDDNVMVPMMMHFDGRAWTEVSLPKVNGMVLAVDASGPNDIWAGGWTPDPQNPDLRAPLLMHWDGQGWSVQPAPSKGTSGSEISDLYVAEPGNVWTIVDRKIQFPADNLGSLWHWDGAAWQAVWPRGERPVGEPDRYVDIDGTGPDDVWAVGETTFTTPWDEGPLPYPLLHARRLISHLSCGGK